jgi:hypothetical protein
MLRRVLPLVLTVSIASCGKDSPSNPTPPPAATRVIEITGTLSFGEVDLGSTAERTAQISNSGTDALTVTGMSGPQGFTASWTNGVIAAGGNQPVVFRFSPTERRDYAGTVTVAANHTAGNNRIDINGTGRQGPRTRFGAGQYRVGDDIAPGRYFTAVTYGCYWERQSSFSGTLLEVLANDFVAYSAPQYIVDILASDVGFKTSAPCGTWDQEPKGGTRATIPPGVWLVGSQVAPGTYRTPTPDGCYWERLRNFEYRFSFIERTPIVSGVDRRFVTIRADDTGFRSYNCGTWELVSGSAASPSEGGENLRLIKGSALSQIEAEPPIRER